MYPEKGRQLRRFSRKPQEIYQMSRYNETNKKLQDVGCMDANIKNHFIAGLVEVVLNVIVEGIVCVLESLN